jgi:TRAP-type uncharacterized transport system substrate-binding protein
LQARRGGGKALLHNPSMSKLLKSVWLSLREGALVWTPFLLITALLLALAYWVLKPAPPKRVVLATGTEQGAYEAFGKQYAQVLARYGITVELRPSQGSVANLQALMDPDNPVEIAFVQGGSAPAEMVASADDPMAAHDSPLISLGSLFYEPVWLFYREDAVRRSAGALGPRTPQAPAVINSLDAMNGWTVNVGTEGSGVTPIVMQLLAANRIAPESMKMLRLAPTPGVMELLEGRADAMFFVSAPESPLVRMLLQTPGIRLFDFAQAEAYSRRFPYLSHVTLPRGIVELGADIPSQDYRLVAPTATLLARRDLHPALIQLFMQAATQLHSPPTWFSRTGEFPSARNNEFPVAPEAQKYLRDGPPFLQRYLPFWAANLVDRMWVVLAAIIAVMLPLSRVIPPLYEFRIRSRVFRWYGQLRAIEERIGQRDADRTALLAELDDVEHRVERISVPLSYADELYALRQHIDMVRARIKLGAGAQT